MPAKVPMSSVRCSQRIVEQLGLVCRPPHTRPQKTLAKMPGSKVIKHAQAHRHVTASSSVLHSWEKGNPIPFTLNVLRINSLDLAVSRTFDDVQGCSLMSLSEERKDSCLARIRTYDSGSEHQALTSPNAQIDALKL